MGHMTNNTKSLTAKAAVSFVAPSGNLEATSIRFYGDYANGANREWSVATPIFALQMDVRNEIIERFGIKPGDKFDVVLVKREE